MLKVLFRRVRQQLRIKILLSTFLITTLATALTYFTLKSVLHDISRGLANDIAVKHAHLESDRLSKLLLIEYNMASLLANQPLIKAWSIQDKAVLSDEQQQLLNLYRQKFSGELIFLANADKGFFSFSDPITSPAIQPLYELLPDSESDRWFFGSLDLSPDCRPNVDYDRGLNATKLWLNCVVPSESEQQATTIIGTGLNLDIMINQATDAAEGFNLAFINERGDIQLHRDESIILQDAFLTEAQDHTSIFQFFEAADVDRVRNLIELAKHNSVEAETITLDNREHLIAVDYIPFLDWYSVVTIDINVLIPRSILRNLQVVFMLIVILVMLATWFQVSRWLVYRIQHLEQSMNSFRTLGTLPDARDNQKFGDEIDRLQYNFRELASDVTDRTHLLEGEVQKRTQELQRLATTDELTQCANRRALIKAINTELIRSNRYDNDFALLIIDLDNFKDINDDFGHLIGDKVLTELSRRCQEVLRDVDMFGRLGGDEFAAMLVNTDIESAQQVANRLLEAISQLDLKDEAVTIHCEASIGIAFSDKHDATFETLYERADHAMYFAKQAGKNQFKLSLPTD